MNARKRSYLPGPLTYFVGNANGRGLIRIETGPDAPVAGEHIASLTRNREADAKEIVLRWNVHEELVAAADLALRRFDAIYTALDLHGCNAVNPAIDAIRAALANARGGR